jgi:small subunit ribosomal protein S17
MADEPDNETETPAESVEIAESSAPEDAGPEETAPEDAAPDAAAGAPEQADATAQAEDSSAAAGAQSPGALSPKERRRKARSTHTGETRPSRSPEERHSERLAERKTKAARRRARRQQERAKRAARSGDAVARDRSEIGQLAPVHSQTEGVRKVRQGVVVSDKADKTITVRIDTARRHRRYEKIVRSSSTLHAHDENNDAHEGDTVRVIESRPLSRTKRWKLVDVLERAR